MMQKKFLSFLVIGLFSSALVKAEVPVVKVDGSSTVFPITEAVAEEFQNSTQGKVRVTVGISGTGGGFKKFCRGETDVQDASRPILKAEIEECAKNNIQYIELPVAFDAITIVVNNKNTWVKELSIEDMKKMWSPESQGKVLKWKDINSAWPDKGLKLFGAGSDSGTFDYFTEAINGKSKASRGDYTGSEDDNTLVVGVSTDEGALGYIPYAYYEANKAKLKIMPIVNKKNNKAVIPSALTIKDGSYFPLSRPVFIYVNKKSREKKEVSDFVNYYITNADKLVTSVKYVPLTKKAYDLGLKRFKDNQSGTGFGGENDIGAKIEEILARKLK